MANPSDKGARGPAGPLAEPVNTPPSPPPIGSAPLGLGRSGSSGAPSGAGQTGAPHAEASLEPGSRRATSSGTSGSRTFEGGNRAFEGGQRAGSMGAGLKDTAQTAADAVRQQAAQFAGDVGHELSRTGEAQKQRGVEAIRSLARAIDSAAEELEPQSPTIARTVHEAARGVEDLSDNLANRNVNELIDSAARLARAQPALFLGGSVAAGFALARFLKSSARQQPAAGFDSNQR